MTPLNNITWNLAPTMRHYLTLIALVLMMSACTSIEISFESGVTPANAPAGETARVTRIIDGDTIDVTMNDETFRVRYIGVDTPERDEPCYQEATEANRALVGGQTITMVRDVRETDRFGRLLRYIYVGDVFVNERLVVDGWARAVSFPPDVTYYDHFRQLERQASQANIGCHPTGIFDRRN